MVTVLPAPERQEGFGALIGRGLGQGFSAGINQGAQFAHAIHKEKVKRELAGKTLKHLEKENALSLGLGTIEKMRGLLSSSGGITSNPGNFLKSLNPNSQTRSERTELEQLGTSLIPLVAAGVPIRNQKEFEQYRKTITDASSSPADLEGALNGLQDLFERSLSQTESTGERSAKEGGGKPIFDPDNPSHMKTREALLKKYRGNREKVAKELARHYREE